MKKFNMQLILFLALMMMNNFLQAAPPQPTRGQASSVDRLTAIEISIGQLKRNIDNHDLQLLRLEDKSSNQEQILEGQQRHFANRINAIVEALVAKVEQLETKDASFAASHTSFIKDLSTLRDHLQKYTEQVLHLQQQFDLLRGALKQQEDNMGHMRKAINTLIEIEGSSTKIIGGTADQTSYIVQQGDNLAKIAEKTGNTIREIKKENNLQSDRIFPGQKLLLPKRSMSTRE